MENRAYLHTFLPPCYRRAVVLEVEVRDNHNLIEISLMPFTRGLAVLFAVAIVLVGCDSGKKLEEESAFSATSADTTALALAETTAIQCVTTDPTPQYVFSSTKPGTVSYSGSCSGDRSYAFAGNNTIYLYSGSGSSGLFIPLSNGAYKDCKVTVTDAGGTAQELAITSFGIIWDMSRTLTEKGAISTCPETTKSPDCEWSA